MNKYFTMAALMTVLMSFVCPITSWAQSSVTIDGVKYELDDSNGTATVGSYNSGIEGDLVIPSSVSYNGVDYPVTSIGERAFYNCIILTSVVIPESVTNIGYEAFWYCSDLTSVVIPASVTSIGESAFFGCSGLTSVVIPEGVTSLGNWAFSGCSGLTSVVIPASVTSIGSDAFDGCSSLPAIEVSPDNMNYISVDGVLYTKDRSELLRFPKGKKETSFVISEGVTSIGERAFANCSGLTSVVIPEGVTSIGDYAFWGCSCLTSVLITENVTIIGEETFQYCSNLTDIYCCSLTPPTNNYGGTICNNTATNVHVPVGSKAVYEAAENFKGLTIVEDLSLDDAVEEVRSGEPFTISVAEGVLQVHATESARLPLYTVGGIMLRVLEVEVGLNTYEGLPQGVYLLNGHKVLIP